MASETRKLDFIDIYEDSGRKVSVGYGGVKAEAYLLGNLPHLTRFELSQRNADAFRALADAIEFEMGK